MSKYSSSDSAESSYEEDLSSDSDDMPVEVSLSSAKAQAVEAITSESQFKQRQAAEQKKKAQAKALKSQQIAEQRRAELLRKQEATEAMNDSDDDFSVADLEYAVRRRETGISSTNTAVNAVATLDDHRKSIKLKKEHELKKAKLAKAFLRLQQSQTASFNFGSKTNASTYKHGDFTVIALNNKGTRSKTVSLLADAYHVDSRRRTGFSNTLPKVARTYLTLRTAPSHSKRRKATPAPDA